MSFSLRNSSLKCMYWNVQTLNRPEGISFLIEDLIEYKIDVAILSEVHWKEQGGRLVEKGYYFLTAAADNRSQQGVGIVLSPRIYSIWKEGGGFWEPISSRLVKIRIPLSSNNKGKYLCFIGVYAPHNERDEETKGKFYEKLEEVCDKVVKGDELVILGDFNARVGKYSEEYPKVVGKFGWEDEVNDNGSRLLNFCIQRKMCIMSTVFEHKDIHKPTWCNKKNGKWHLIDHILINQAKMNYITNVVNRRGTRHKSDHIMVEVVLKMNIPDRKRRYYNTSTGIDREKTKININPEVPPNPYIEQFSKTINQFSFRYNNNNNNNNNNSSNKNKNYYYYYYYYL
jgi:hypothetical protein